MSTPAGYISIADYGAVGDGKTDDTAAIQAAFNYAEANGLGVYIPPGTYNYSNNLTATGIKVMGAGNTSILAATNQADENLALEGNGGSLSDMELTAPSGSRLQTAASAKIGIYGATNFSVDNVTITGAGSAGMIVMGASNGQIYDNTVTGTNADGIQMVAGSNNLTVYNNTVYKTGDDGISAVSYQSAGPAVSNITIENNNISGNVGGRGITDLGSNNINILNNTVTGGTAGYAGIYIASEDQYETWGVSNVLVQGNTLNATGGATSGHGAIEVYDSTGLAISGLTINGNSINNSEKAGITFLNSGTTNALIENNTINGTNDVGISATGAPAQLTVVNNTIENTKVGGISISGDAGASMVVDGNKFINLNTAGYSGVDVIATASGALNTLQVTNNSVTQTNGEGLAGFLNDAAGSSNVTVSGNATTLSSNYHESGAAIPVVVNQTLTDTANTALAISNASMLAGDSDPSGHTLTVIGAGDAVNGTLSTNGSGVLVFTPTSGFTGNASFEYIVSDGTNVNAAAVTIAVGNAVVTPPTISISSQALADDTGISATDNITSDGKVTLSGIVNGPTGTIVQVLDGANVLGAATIGSNDSWSYTTTLAAGTHTLHAVATDSAGSVTAAQTEPTITVETVAPIISITSQVLANTTSASGAIITDGSVTLSGTLSGAAGTIVQVDDGSTLLGSATLNSTGGWSYTTTLATGPHTLHAVATDLAGNTTATTAEPAITTAPQSTVQSQTAMISVEAASQNFNGPAEFQLLVDGKAVGPVETVNTQYGQGWEDFQISTTLTTANKTIGVEFLNDAYQPGMGDRNLFVESVAVNGTLISTGTQEQAHNGALSYNLSNDTQLWTPTKAVTFDVEAASQNFNGPAEFQLLVDGKAVGPVETVNTQYGQGWEKFAITATLPVTSQTVSVNFINDAYQAGVGDRNLYVDGISANGVILSNTVQEQAHDGSLNYALTGNPAIWSSTAASAASSTLYSTALSSGTLATTSHTTSATATVAAEPIDTLAHPMAADLDHHPVDSAHHMVSDLSHAA